MNREEMIEWLIDNDLTTDGWGSFAERDNYLATVLREGFVGYAHQTDAQLRDEVKARGGEV